MKGTFVNPKYVVRGYDNRKGCKSGKSLCYGTVRCLWDTDPVEQAIQIAVPEFMTVGTENPVSIKMIMGFELFNRVPYHNYENWSSGFVVEGKGFWTSAEYLDTAVYSWAEAVVNASGDERRIAHWKSFMERPVGCKPLNLRRHASNKSRQGTDPKASEATQITS